MCLAIPAQVTSLTEDMLAEIETLGVTRSISTRLTPHAKVGDWVLVHAGFSIDVIDGPEAEKTLELLQEMADLEEELG